MPMDLVNASSLAPLLPLLPAEQLFQYTASLDGSYATMRVDGAGKLDPAKCPGQFSQKLIHNTTEQWYVGVNVFAEKGQVYYQSFFWKGAADPNTAGSTVPPATQRLATNEGQWQFAGNVVPLDVSGQGTAVSTVSLPKYPWLTCTAAPAFASFTHVISDGQITPNMANPQPQIASSSKYNNDTKDEVTYTPNVTYSFAQEISHSVTDTHGTEYGVEAGWQGEVGWFVAKSKFSLKVSFKYSSSQSTTDSTTQTSSYDVSESATVVVAPGKSKYVSIVIWADQNATADMRLDMTFSGKINGTPLSGAYLKSLAQAMDPASVFGTVGDTSVVYVLVGQVKAAVASQSEVTVTDDPPTVSEGRLSVSASA